MRPLSEYQARTCETAQHPKCVCRCGGKLHGRWRANAATGGAGVEEIPREWFEELPEEDPHHIPTVEEVQAHRRELKRAARLRAKRRRQPVLPPFADVMG